MRDALIVALMLTAAIPTAAAAETVLRLERQGDVHVLTRDGETLGRLTREGNVTHLDSNAARVSLERIEAPLQAGAPYPVRVIERAQLEAADVQVTQQYDKLAPDAPIDIEGLGLVLDGEDPEVNGAEHEQLRAWLRETGLEADTASFEEIHRASTGRDLRVWYEIAGRRVEGSLSVDRSPTPAARFDSAFHVTGEGWKIHHARELFYHRESLEMVDTLVDVNLDAPNEIRSYQCGCYGWAIGGDWVTVGDEYLYHAVVEWKHHRVGAGLFLGVQTTGSFPWLALADRDHVGRMARRAGAYRLTDAKEEPFAEITIELDPFPPPGKLGPQSYEVRTTGTDGTMAPIARIEADESRIEVRLLGDPAESQRALDELFAAMPTQIVRGDGLRDSYLGQAETLVDWVRLIDAPSESTLADVVSEIDALTAVSKVRRLIEPHADRFAIEASEYQPLAPEKRSREPS